MKILHSFIVFAVIAFFYAAVGAALYFLGSAYAPTYEQGRGMVRISIFKIIAISTVLLFLMKGLIPRGIQVPRMKELNRGEHPRLFALLDHVSGKLNYSMPHRVYLVPEANMYAGYDGGFFSLFLPARRHLIVGMSILNAFSARELTAGIAHEFGHFGQNRRFFDSLTYRFHCALYNMAYVEDAIDRFVAQIYFLYYIVGAVRYLFRGYLRLYVAVVSFATRQMEIEADRASALVAGKKTTARAFDSLMLAAYSDWMAMERARLNSYYYFKLPASIFQIQRKYVAELADPLYAREQEEFRKYRDESVNRKQTFYDTHPPLAERISRVNELADVPDDVAIPFDGPARELLSNPQQLEEQLTMEFYEQTLRSSLKDFEIIPSEALQKEFDQAHERRKQYSREFGLKVLEEIKAANFDIGLYKDVKTRSVAKLVEPFENLIGDLCGCLDLFPDLKPELLKAWKDLPAHARYAVARALGVNADAKEVNAYRNMFNEAGNEMVKLQMGRCLSYANDFSALDHYVARLDASVKEKDEYRMNENYYYVIDICEIPEDVFRGAAFIGSPNLRDVCKAVVKWVKQNRNELAWSKEKVKFAKK